ncbi:hypothetical protein M0R45_008275 [Rubus argutus]|uniref:Helicase C-terminal domain-containing protein n=1 Tax=Rubus argutus TaxID=59490 RepID=A0AAW1Y1R1_RUBAR
MGVRKQIKARGDLAFFDSVEHTLKKDEDFKRKVAIVQDLREMTIKVLHYYKGDFLDELPGLVEFTVVLNLSSRQKAEFEKLKGLDKLKRMPVGSLVSMHPELKYLSEKYPSTEKAAGFQPISPSPETYGEIGCEGNGLEPRQGDFCDNGLWGRHSLVGASRVLIMDVQLNPSVTRQAIGRAFRPGQKKKVHVYRLIAADSPEEDDYALCYRKEMISKMWFEWNESCGHQDYFGMKL